MANPFLFEDSEQLSEPALSFNPFLSSNEYAETAASDNPFLSSFTASQDTTAANSSSSATNPFAFGDDTSASSDFFGNSQSAVNYENIFSSTPQTTQVPSSINVNVNESLINDDNFIIPAETEPELKNDGDLPRRPPPPRPLPPRETTELIKTVTGAMEATSSHLLDRLQATRTPSPTPMRDLHSPSPTQFGDLLEVDEPFSAFPTENQQPNQIQPSNEINLMDDFDFSTPADPVQIIPTESSLIATTIEPAKAEITAPITPPPTPAMLYNDPSPAQVTPAISDQNITKEIESTGFTPVEQAQSPITPVHQPQVTPIQPQEVTPVQTPQITSVQQPEVTSAPQSQISPVQPVKPPPPVSRPPPPSIPQRPKPPVQPPRPAPPAVPSQPPQQLVDQSQEITKDEGFADVFGVSPLQEAVDQKEPATEKSNLFDSAFNNTGITGQNEVLQNTSFTQDSFAMQAPSQTKIFSEQDNSTDLFDPRADNGAVLFSGADMTGNDAFSESSIGNHNDAFGAVDTKTDLFSNTSMSQQSYNIFDSTAAKPASQDVFDAFAAKFDSVPSNQTNIEPGNAFDPFGVGGTGQTDTSDGFGADDNFDAFLALSQPPPVPQGTPARVSRGQSAESDSGNDFNVFIKPKDEESEKYTPVALPPPKSPQSSMFQDTSPRFNPFDNTQETTAPIVQNIFAQEGVPEQPFKPPERTDSQETPPTPLFDEDVSQPLEEFPRIHYEGPGWEMHLRQPNKKKITGQRFWKKIWVKLVYQGENPVLQLFNGKDDKDPFQELPLQPCYSVSDIGAQQFDQYGKIFTIKLQFIFYKERPGVRPGQVTKAERLTNKLSQFAAYAIQGDYQGVKEFGSDLRKLGLPVEHAPQISQLFKLGSFSYEDMKQLSVTIEEALFKLSAHRDRALNYKMEEVQITAVDELYVEQNAYGGVLKQIARVRLFFLGFLSGMPDIEIGVNDLVRQGKEVVGRHDIIPVVTEEWIRLEHVEFHSCIQQDEYERTKTIKLKPPDACYIELMRFRVRPPKNRELPLQVKATMCVNGNKVELRSDILVPGFTSRKLGQIPCEDVMVRFPIPECWIYLFRVEKHFRYGSVKSAHRRTGKVKGIERFLGAVDNLEPSLMEVTSGQAKYEHQHRAIVWRIPRLPKEGQGAYTTHNFVSRMCLTSYDQIPEELAKYCYVEFTMPATTVSHMTVRSVSISNSDSDTPPEKYVRQLSRHEYRVEIEHTQAEGPGDYVAVTKTSAPAPVPEEPAVTTTAPPDSDSDSSG